MSGGMGVSALWRFPVKSMRGEALDRVRIERDGLAGDRSVTLRKPDGGLVTARVKERMLGVETTLGPDGGVLIDGHRWDSAAAAEIAVDLVGEGARFEAAEDGHLYDDTPLLVTTDGGIRTIGEAIGRPGLEPLRFRANIHLDGVDGLEESEWPGRLLRVGAATLKVEWTCERCKITTIDPDPASLEIDADVLRTIKREFDGQAGLCCSVSEPGEVALGDAAELL